MASGRSFLDGAYERESASEKVSRRQAMQETLSSLIVFVMIYAALFIVFRPDLLLSTTMAAGGDTGTHHFGIKFLIEELLPQGRLTGFTLDWYAGMPMLSFYFPLPYFLVAALSQIMDYNIAFKLVTALGTFMLPPAVFLFIRSLRFKFPYPLLGSVFSLVFLFMNSYAIYGGNMLSTMAGEFGYSLSFAIVFVFLATFRRSLFSPRLDWLLIANCLILAAIALSHVLTTVCLLVMLIGYAFYQLKARSYGATAIILLTGFSLTAFWSVPFAYNLRFTPNMGWKHITTPRPLVANELLISFVLCLLGISVYLYYLAMKEDRRHLFLLWSLTAFAVLFFMPTGGRVWNARILPFYYIIVNIWAAYFLYVLYFGLVHVLKKKKERKVPWLKVLYVPVILAIALSIILGTKPTATGWALYNYSGYEAKEGWPLYSQVMDYIKGLETGRFMVEQDKEKVQKFGTSRAFELIPYFTSHPTMEGLLVEGAFTSFFHFINQAELSTKPSNAIPSLQKPPKNVQMGITHLQMFGVRYMIASSEEVIEDLKKDPRANLLESFEDFHIFEIENPHGYIEIPEYMPLRVRTGDWYGTIREWYLNEEALQVPILWDQGQEGLEVFDLTDEEGVRDPRSERLHGSGSPVLLEFSHERIMFQTDAIGLPHIIKVSYFPNWQADGALGPFAVSPSLMLVIPTQKDVTLYYAKTWVNRFSDSMTAAGSVLLLGAAVYLAIRKIRTRQRDGRSPKSHDRDASGPSQ